MKVLQFPLAKISIGFLLGIIIAQLFKNTTSIAFGLLIFCLALLTFLFFQIKKKPKLTIYFGLTVVFTSIAVGVCSLSIQNQTTNSKHYLHQLQNSNDANTAQLIVKEKLKNTYNNNRYVANIISLNNKESLGKIILNVNKDSTANDLQVGNIILVKGDIYKNRKPNNPDQFDYGKYLENQQIYAQIYANSENIKVSPEVEKGLNYYGAKLRNTIIQNLQKAGFKQRELSVVIALILGQQQDISQDVIRDYQYAGAIHILSVSGLHVGFILLFITFLLQPIANTRKGLTIKLIVTIVSLWMFGILAGLAPSVVRSVTMFSFVAVGIYLRRSVNIYHTLLVSMLLILLFQPSFLFDIGFQLSYIALFFIVWLQPLLKSIWSPENKIVTYFWDIITVSFAAQIGTLPLSVYYFHQFPGLFFVTNIIILPMLTIILAIALFVIILAAFNYVPYYPMKILEWSIVFLNKIISWVASLEDLVFKSISLNSYMMWSSYLIIIAVIIWAKKPTFNKIAIALSFVILFQLFNLNAKYKSQTESELIVFNRKGYTLITERNANKVRVYSNDSIIKNHDDNLVLKSYLVANFSNIDKLEITKNYYFFNNKKIALLDSSNVFLEMEKPDVLLLSNSPKVNLERLFESWKPEQVVVDASNFSNYRKLWKATCAKQKILFHDTTEKGFYKLN